MRRNARRFSRLAASFLTSVALGLGTGIGGDAATPAFALEDGSPPFDVEVLARSLRFREEFGFSTDVSLVQAVELDPDSHREYGVSLTSEEAAEIDRRSEITRGLRPLETFVEERLETTAGVFVDHKAGGVVVVNVVGAPSRDRATMAALAPAGADLEFREVGTSMATLRSIESRALSRLPVLESDGIEIPIFGIRLPENLVMFQLARLDPDWINAIREEVGASAIEFKLAEAGEPAACTQKDCMAPERFRAALRIFASAGGLTKYCTSGFMVHTGTDTKVVTAGHCFSDANVGHQVYHGWPWYDYESVGPVLSTAYYDYSDIDAMVVAVANSRESNWIFGTLSVQFGVGYPSVGTVVCMKGQQSGSASVCGQILANDENLTYPDGTHFIDQILTTIPVMSGDSGGPVYSNSNLAYGIVVYRSGDDSYFSRMDYVENELNVAVCGDLACT